METEELLRAILGSLIFIKVHGWSIAKQILAGNDKMVMLRLCNCGFKPNYGIASIELFSDVVQTKDLYLICTPYQIQVQIPYVSLKNYGKTSREVTPGTEQGNKSMKRDAKRGKLLKVPATNICEL